MRLTEIGRFIAAFLVLSTGLAIGQELEEAARKPVPVADPAPQVKIVQVETAVWPKTAKLVGQVHFEVFKDGASPFDEPILKGVTDELGKAQIEVPLSALRTDYRGRLKVSLQVAEPGLQKRFGRTLDLEPGSEDPLIVYIQTKEGVTAIGRRLAPDGSGVQAKLELLPEGIVHMPTPKPSNFSVGWMTNGWFLIHFKKSCKVDIYGKAEKVGTGALFGVELDAEHPRSDIELKIGGTGVIRGVVVDKQGMPSAGLSVRVELERSMAPRSGPRRHKWNAGEPGITRAYTYADRDGRFEIKGLRNGQYNVTTLRTESGTFVDEPIIEGTLAADGSANRIFFSRPSLQIQLLDFDGRPCQSRLGGTFPGPGISRTQESTWMTDPRIYVRNSEDGGFGPWASEYDPEGHDLGQGFATFTVGADRDYWVGIIGGGFSGTFQHVHIPADGSIKRIQFRAKRREPLETGTLDASVVMANGAERSRSTDTVYWVETMDQGIRIDDRGPSSFHPIVVGLPPGQYRVVAEGRPGIGLCGPGPARRLGRVEQVVTIEPGKVTKAKLTLLDGGRLSVLLDGVLNESDTQAIAAKKKALEESEHPLAILHQSWAAEEEECNGVADVVLFRRKQVHQRLYWYCPGSKGFNYLLPLAQEVTSRILSQGVYEMRVTLPGGRTFKQEVEIKTGETTSAVVIW